jgi:hypothetical protein
LRGHFTNISNSQFHKISQIQGQRDPLAGAKSHGPCIGSGWIAQPEFLGCRRGRSLEPGDLGLVFPGKGQQPLFGKRIGRFSETTAAFDLLL